MEQLTVPSRYVHSMLRLAEHRQCNVDELLIALGTDQQQLKNCESVPILFYGELYHTIVERLQDEWFGLLSAGSVRKGSMRFFFQAMVHCKNLEQMIYRSADFFEICHGYTVKQTFEVDGDDVIFKISKLDCVTQNSYEQLMQQAPINVIKSTLLAWLGINNWLIGANIPLKELFYRFTESDDQSLNPSCKISHKQEFYGYRVSAEYLQYPIVQKEENIEDFISRAPYFVFMHVPKKDIAQQIKSILAKSAGHEYPTAEEIALSLHISPQTFYRRLKSEGITYLELKNTSRAEVAIHYLNRQELTNEAISSLLGFENPSTFYRAFKKWTGVSPGEYRKRFKT